MSTMELKYTENGVGVVIENFNIKTDLTSAKIVEIQTLLNSYRVVVFKKQSLNNEQFEDFAFRFGAPFTTDSKNQVLGSEDRQSSIVVVGNQALEFEKSYLGHQEVLPHSDHQWLKYPSAASMLYAIDVNERSANTIWYDIAKAYALLDSDMKAMIESIKTIVYNPFHRPFGSVKCKYVDRAIDIPPGNVYPHPLVRTHPLTGEKILYINFAYELEFQNLSVAEGTRLLEELYRHVQHIDCKYEHRWENGDLVFWDNRATLHYRPSFDSTVRRVLKRVSIAGEYPF
ncbi:MULTISPECIES: TauD/TfdA dioxygenase family protein [Sphingobacterium]|uniref:TauD/TfdA dioxygenase family protein n=1 Tax=Sphingobacterium TaxID=28453 RepID=UPI001053C4FE|nr:MULTISPECIES: TauD/TfdA family dioxygenase [Sphingobacterium]MCW2258605.1 taurine dioxygenase [Sphingobacterium kitahiroshimense]TCR14938.1 taurine dioxygenase [Sphingobacterium sp. JUb78]